MLPLPYVPPLSLSLFLSRALSLALALALFLPLGSVAQRRALT